MNLISFSGNLHSLSYAVASPKSLSPNRFLLQVVSLFKLPSIMKGFTLLSLKIKTTLSFSPLHFEAMILLFSTALTRLRQLLVLFFYSIVACLWLLATSCNLANCSTILQFHFWFCDLRVIWAECEFTTLARPVICNYFAN